MAYNPMYGMTALEQTRFVILRELSRYQRPIDDFLKRNAIFKGRDSMVKLRLRVEPQLNKIVHETKLSSATSHEEFYDTERNILLEAKFGEMKALVIGELQPLLLNASTHLLSIPGWAPEDVRDYSLYQEFATSQMH
jgi:hypothetical protein